MTRDFNMSHIIKWVLHRTNSGGHSRGWSLLYNNQNQIFDTGMLPSRKIIHYNKCPKYAFKSATVGDMPASLIQFLESLP